MLNDAFFLSLRISNVTGTRRQSYKNITDDYFEIFRYSGRGCQIKNNAISRVHGRREGKFEPWGSNLRRRNKRTEFLGIVCLFSVTSISKMRMTHQRCRENQKESILFCFRKNRFD